MESSDVTFRAKGSRELSRDIKVNAFTGYFRWKISTLLMKHLFVSSSSLFLLSYAVPQSPKMKTPPS